MMREQVLIVLNEREAQKRRAAELLAGALQERGITSSRLKIDDQIERRIIERHPPILVIDYLLGDSSTALDVLAKLQNALGTETPLSFLFTDEPSATVAAAALRLGARNFFPLDNPASIEQLADEIATARPRQQEKPPAPDMGLDELVAGDPEMQRLIQRITLSYQGNDPAVLIAGRSGSGRSTIARALGCGATPCTTIEHDFRYARWGAHESVKRWERLISKIPNSSRALLILEHMRGSDAESAEILAPYFKRWATLEGRPIIPLIIADDDEIGRIWERLLDIKAHSIPSLAARSSDLAALAQRFFKMALQAVGVKGKVLDAPHLQILTKLTWPQELHSLRRTLATAATLLSIKERSLNEIIPEAHELMLAESVQTPVLLERLSAARTLWECQGDPGRAAVRLGCSVSELAALFHQEPRS